MKVDSIQPNEYIMAYDGAIIAADSSTTSSNELNTMLNNTHYVDATIIKAAYTNSCKTSVSDEFQQHLSISGM